MARQVLDKSMDKVVSRKLLVWVVATALAVYGIIPGADWVTISAIYIGSQSVIDAIAKMRGVSVS